MKQKGAIKTIDEVGRIVIPEALRRKAGLEERCEVEIYAEKDRIIVRRYKPGCVFCGSTRDNVKWMDKLVCRDCLDGLKKGIFD